MDGLALYLDAPKLSRNLRAREHGQAAGRKNQPPAHAADFDAFETSVNLRCDNALSTLKRQTSEYLQQLALQLNSIKLEPLAAKIRDLISRTEREFKRLLEDRKDVLINLRRSELLREREYKFFVERNQIDREPEVFLPTSVAVGILILSVLVEGGLNAGLLEITDFGWLGGFTVAVAVSLINVLISFAVGMFILRNLYHVNKWKRVSAVILGGLVLGVLYYGHYLFGRYRALLNDPRFDLPESDEVARAVPNFSQIVSDPVSWPPAAVGLVVIGVLFSFFAIWDGIYSGDKYPGFSRIHRAYQKAMKAYADAKAKFRNDAVEIVERTKRDLDLLLDENRKREALYRSYFHQFNAALTIYGQNAAQIVNVCGIVIQDYRLANLSVRNAAPPTYFEEGGGRFPKYDSSLPDVPIIGDSRIDEFAGINAASPSEIERTKVNLDNGLNEKFAEIDKKLQWIDDTLAGEMISNEERAKAAEDLAP